MRASAYPQDIEISEVQRADVVVVGCGAAGLYTALKMDPRMDCLLVTKEAFAESSSYLAQGGIAAAIARDDRPQLHFEDTLVAGAGLCDESAVRTLVDEGPEAIADLIRLQVPLDLNEDGELHITREGGHTRNRVVHAGGDATGRETVKVLAGLVRRQPNIRVLPHAFLVDILTDGSRATGILTYREGGFTAILAGAVVLCTGGIGQVFGSCTTNPHVATGDGLAAAVRCGVPLHHMEFIQFHPTGFYHPDDGGPAFLISEALRGEGALLRNAEGARFMRDGLREMAPRDIVARAIVEEMRRGGTPCVFLDMTHKSFDELATRFPTIVGHCLRRGIDISRDFIPVRPVQHYMMGGLPTDLFGCTARPGLYACGEVSCTGVHGANRLASNSLLECLVFGRRVATHIAESFVPVSHDAQVDLPPAVAASRRVTPPDIARSRMAESMVQGAGVVRSEAGLKAAEAVVRGILDEYKDANLPTKAHWETLALATVSSEIIAQALRRRESVGAHFRMD